MFLKFLRSSGLWLRRSFAVGPLEMALCVILFVASVLCEIDAGGLTWVKWRALFWGAAVTVPVSFAASYLAFTGRLRAPVRWGIQIAALALGAFVTLRANYDYAAWIYAVGALITASLGLLMIAPGFRGASEESLASYALQVLGRASLGGLYALLLFAGIAGAILAVGELFNLSVDYLLRHVMALNSLFLFPALVIGAASEIWEAEQQRFAEDSRLGRATATYLFAPLMVVYLVILYLYLGKAVLTGDWPSNLVSPLVLGAALMGFLGQVVLGSVWAKEEEHPTLSGLFRGFSFAMVIPVLLGFTAISMRLKQYGITPARYLIVSALTLTLVLVVLDIIRTLRKKTPSIFALGLLATLFVLVGGVGPLSAANVTLRAQGARILERADAAQVRLDGAWLESEAMLDKLQELREMSIHGENTQNDEQDVWRSPYYTVSQDVNSLVNLVGPARAGRALQMTASEVERIAEVPSMLWRAGTSIENPDEVSYEHLYTLPDSALRLSETHWSVGPVDMEPGRTVRFSVDGCEDLRFVWPARSEVLEVWMGDGLLYKQEQIHALAQQARNRPYEGPPTVFAESAMREIRTEGEGVNAIWTGFRMTVRNSDQAFDQTIGLRVVLFVEADRMTALCQGAPVVIDDAAPEDAVEQNDAVDEVSAD